MQQKKGFTLIELLVVIAIIGILTSVVLASLNSARTKGGDAGVKENLSSVRSQAEVYYNDNNNYGNVTALAPTASSCTAAGVAGTVFADPSVKAAIAQAVSNAGSATSGWCATNANPATAYAVAVPLKSFATTFWCIDSTGVATSTIGVAGAPVASTGKCQ